jgi:hypothetical protein
MFKEIFIKEFAGTLDNKYFWIRVGDEVEFKYKGKVVKGTVTEIEDGKHGKAIVALEKNPVLDSKQPIEIHVSKLKTKNSKNQKIKEVKDKDIVYT